MGSVMANEDVDPVSIQADALANLYRALRGYTSILAEMAVNPKPSYELDGQKFEWKEYQEFILTNMKVIREQIQSLDGPFEIESQGYC